MEMRKKASQVNVKERRNIVKLVKSNKKGKKIVFPMCATDTAERIEYLHTPQIHHWRFIIQ